MAKVSASLKVKDAAAQKLKKLNDQENHMRFPGVTIVFDMIKSQLGLAVELPDIIRGCPRQGNDSDLVEMNGSSKTTTSPANPPAKKLKEKKSGEYMIAAPIVHPDELFWLFLLAHQCYCGDYWVLSFVATEPLLVNLLCRAIAKPGDPNRACNNIIPVDLRHEFSTPHEVIDTITGGKFVEATEKSRPNSEWVKFFPTSLAPDSMDHLDKKAQRLLCVLAQGGDYLPKASNVTLAMIFYSIAIAGVTLSRYGWFKAVKCVAISGAHINIMHILRDHSISGLTHHGAHNVGEFDKAEFVKKSLRASLFWVLVSFIFDWPIIHIMANIQSIKCIAFSTHTLTHYTRSDIKGKGPGRGYVWKLLLDAYEVLAACKIVTSKQYHASHHFHNEMSYPAILMPFNEYLNAKSLTPFLTQTLDGKRLGQLEKFLNLFYLGFLYTALAA